MGHTGVPTPPEVIDKIVRLRDEQGLDWSIIAQRFGISVPTAIKVYRRRKDGGTEED